VHGLSSSEAQLCLAGKLSLDASALGALGTEIDGPIGRAVPKAGSEARFQECVFPPEDDGLPRQPLTRRQIQAIRRHAAAKRHVWRPKHRGRGTGSARTCG